MPVIGYLMTFLCLALSAWAILQPQPEAVRLSPGAATRLTGRTEGLQGRLKAAFLSVVGYLTPGRTQAAAAKEGVEQTVHLILNLQDPGEGALPAGLGKYRSDLHIWLSPFQERPMSDVQRQDLKLPPPMPDFGPRTLDLIYLTSILICFGLASSALGMFTSKTPSLKTARILSARIAAGSVKARWKLP